MICAISSFSLRKNNEGVTKKLLLKEMLHGWSITVYFCAMTCLYPFITHTALLVMLPAPEKQLSDATEKACISKTSLAQAESVRYLPELHFLCSRGLSDLSPSSGACRNRVISSTAESVFMEFSSRI